MRLSNLIIIILVFISGWTLSDMFNSMNSEQPSTITGALINNINNERASPSNIVPEEDIHVYKDRIVIEIDNAVWARFADSNSMDPVLDKGANAIQIVPTSLDQIKVGDIISFKSNYQSGIIIHRVVEQGADKDGWYVITKGDNNTYRDPEKVRFEDIKKVLVGIIY